MIQVPTGVKRKVEAKRKKASLLASIRPLRIKGIFASIPKGGQCINHAFLFSVFLVI